MGAFGDTHKVKTGVRLGKMSFRLVVVPKRACPSASSGCFRIIFLADEIKTGCDFKSYCGCPQQSPHFKSYCAVVPNNRSINFVRSDRAGAALHKASVDETEASWSGSRCGSLRQRVPLLAYAQTTKINPRYLCSYSVNLH